MSFDALRKALTDGKPPLRGCTMKVLRFLEIREGNQKLVFASH